MEKYILVYETHEYKSDGGGIKIKEFTTPDEMHNFAKELIIDEMDNVSILHAGLLTRCYKYNVIEYAVKIEPELIV